MPETKRIVGGEIVIKNTKTIIRIRYSDGSEIERATSDSGEELLPKISADRKEVSALAEKRIAAREELIKQQISDDRERAKRLSALRSKEEKKRIYSLSEEEIRRASARVERAHRVRLAQEKFLTILTEVEEML